MKTAIPADDTHKHFGGGRTEILDTLQLVLGDWSHIPHQLPIMSQPITVTVR